MAETETTTLDDSPIEHVHFGAGTFGLGMVVEICHGEAGLKTAVVNRDSRREYHKILKSKGNYSVLFDGDRQKILKPKFCYHTTENEQSIVDLLSGPSVALITTSVKKDNLPAIAPLLARGLLKRANGGTTEQKLCVMACENLVDNSAELRKQVESHLPHGQATHLLSGVFFCNTLVDRICAPVSCRTGSVQIPTESFHL
jgi:mannitol-1-phosphate 5-dehydrogenase